MSFQRPRPDRTLDALPRPRRRRTPGPCRGRDSAAETASAAALPVEPSSPPADPRCPATALEADTGLDSSPSGAELREEAIERGLHDLHQANLARLPEADSLVGGRPVRGYDHEAPFSLDEFLEAMATTGFQATHLARAIQIVREVRDREVPLYLAFTSNIGTCGLRETITYLTRHRHVRALATTAGAIEEDVIKVFAPFLLGTFESDDRDLFRRMINRTGNIYIPSDRYSFLRYLLYVQNLRLVREQAGEARPVVGITRYVRELGRQLELLEVPRREESFVYWAYRNDIDLHCPVLLDGAIGDALYLFRRNPRTRLGIDATEYVDRLTDDMILSSQAHGGIALLAIGGSVPKHMICNAAIFAGGARYAVYVNTAGASDGSNAGAPVEEAITWGKVHPGAEIVKVEAEATLVLPLLVAAAFQTYVPAPTGARERRETDDVRFEPG